jgi:hypothetical protein
MTNRIFDSMEDIKKTIYREYEKINNKFIAMDKFFISEEVDKNRFEYIQFYSNKESERIIPVDNDSIYMSIDKSKLKNKNLLDLIILSNVCFSLDENNINKNDIIKKYINSNDESNDSFNRLLEEIYYNNEFSNKINIELPSKYINTTDLKKKYLFKVDYYRDYSLNNRSEIFV